MSANGAAWSYDQGYFTSFDWLHFAPSPSPPPPTSSHRFSMAEGINADGRMEVFLIGQDGRLYTAEQMGAGGDWTSWSSLGGSWPGADAIAEGANADGRMEVFLVGQDSQLHTAWQTQPNEGWSSWESLGGSWP